MQRNKEFGLFRKPSMFDVEITGNSDNNIILLKINTNEWQHNE